MAFAMLVSLLLSGGYSSAAAESWQAEIANDSPNGFKFSDAYETHTMSLRRHLTNGTDDFSAAIVAPKRPEDIDEDWPANRAFGELLTFKSTRAWFAEGERRVHRGFAVTLIGEFGLDAMQEAFHDLLGYRSVRDQLVSHRMDDGLMLSGFIGFRQPWRNNLQMTGEMEFGTRRNALSMTVSKPSNCENWNIGLRAGIELIANDEVVSAEPTGADIRHIVPHIGVGTCTTWRGYRIRISEEVSLPRIASDDDLYPMVRVSVAF